MCSEAVAVAVCQHEFNEKAGPESCCSWLQHVVQLATCLLVVEDQILEVSCCSSLLPQQHPVSYSCHAMCSEAVYNCASAGPCLRQVRNQACQVPLPLQLSREQLRLPRPHPLRGALCRV